jgi:thiol-disulfide isomerase/thioredoxin
MQFLALVDADGDGRSFNDEPRPLRFSDFYARNRAGTKVIMVNAAAGWCAPCMTEAAKLGELAAAYGPRGVVVLTAVFQNADAAPADRAFATLWGQTFNLSIPILIDPAFATSRYFDRNTMPANMFVDAENAQILRVATGAEPGGDPLRPYRELLDHYLGGR